MGEGRKLATPAQKGSGLKATVKTILNVTSFNHLKSGTAMCSFFSHNIDVLLVTLTTKNSICLHNAH
jgi:hypothetical protein